MKRKERTAYRAVVGVLVVCVLTVMAAFRAERRERIRVTADLAARSSEISHMTVERNDAVRRAAEAQRIVMAEICRAEVAAYNAAAARQREAEVRAAAVAALAETARVRTYSRTREDRLTLLKADRRVALARERARGAVGGR